MTGPVIVGVEASDRAADALALGSRLAEVAGAELLLVCAYPYEAEEEGEGRPEYEALVRGQAEEVLAARRAEVDGVAVRTLAAPGFSAARVLHEAAEREGGVAIVVASTHRGSPGRVATGTVADRLLTGAPCPVAVAPHGYATAPRPAGFERVGVAFVAGEAGHNALRVADLLAQRVGARVRLLAVTAPRVWQPDAWAGRARPEELAAAQREVAARHAAEAVAELPDGAAVDVEIREGDPVAELREASETLDLLVCGSRAYGPASVVLVGGVSKALAREAACPVLVVPRGAHAPLATALASGGERGPARS
jgi:nucleotide-binding universal stress UspA family protein